MQKKIIIHSASKKKKWEDFISINSYEANVLELVVDFSSCNFLEPSDIVQMACLIEQYYQKRVKISFIESKTPALNKYLLSINFINYWTPNFERPNYSQSLKTTHLYLWKLSKEHLTPYVSHAKEYFENNISVEPRVDFYPLYVTLSELFNNILDHSISQVSGYTTCQFYPNLNKLRIAVCDLGIGIPTAVNNFLSKEANESLSSVDALKKAFENGFSTQSTPRNRGYGLSTLKSIVKNCNGSLKVTSNNAIMTIQPNSNEERFEEIQQNFQGTIFNITLDTTTFDPKDNIILEDEFIY